MWNRRGNVPGQALTEPPSRQPRAGFHASTAASRCLHIGSRLPRRCAKDPVLHRRRVARESDTAGHSCCPATGNSSCGCAEGLGSAARGTRHPISGSAAASECPPGLRREPRTHPSSISPPMVWVANGRQAGDSGCQPRRRAARPPVTSGRDGTGRVRKTVGPNRIQPTRCRRVEGGAEGEAKGLSIGIARELGIRDTVKKHERRESTCGAISTDAEWPMIILSRAKLGTFMLATHPDIYLHSDNHRR